MDKNNILDENKLCVEITYDSESLMFLKSYYMMTQNEYDDLKTQHIDIFIENFINNEDLTKDKLDIHIVQNTNSVKLINDFIQAFGNPFDILLAINNRKQYTDDFYTSVTKITDSH